MVTDLVPSEMACLASSPGRIRRTAVWISRDEIVDFLEYDASSAGPSLRLEVQSKVGGTRTGGFCSDALENVVHERVEDSHRLVRDTRIRMHLLEHCRPRTDRQHNSSTRQNSMLKSKLRSTTRLPSVPWQTIHFERRGRTQNATHPCRCKTSTSPCVPFCASSSPPHRQQRRSPP